MRDSYLTLVSWLGSFFLSLSPILSCVSTVLLGWRQFRPTFLRHWDARAVHYLRGGCTMKSIMPAQTYSWCLVSCIKKVYARIQPYYLCGAAPFVVWTPRLTPNMSPMLKSGPAVPNRQYLLSTRNGLCAYLLLRV